MKAGKLFEIDRLLSSSPQERVELYYVPKFMARLTLPRRILYQSEWSRKTLNDSITILSPKRYGIPAGHLSRLIFCDLTRRAKVQKSTDIKLPKSRKKFMASLGSHASSGGINGSNPSFRRHFLACLNSTIHLETNTHKETVFSTQSVIEEAKIIGECDQWNARITLDNGFYNGAQSALPIDWGRLLFLSPSTINMDLYIYLIHRLFRLRRTTCIDWHNLFQQFGNPSYRICDFRKQFKKALTEVQTVYPEAKVITNKSGLILYPSPQHIQSY